MSVCQSRPGPARSAAARLEAGQLAVHDLRTRSSIVAVEGNLQLAFRDHSLAWLGDAVPLTSIILHEGECFVTPQRGVVSISAAQAGVAAFVVQPSNAWRGGSGSFRQRWRQLARLFRTGLRRAV